MTRREVERRPTEERALAAALRAGAETRQTPRRPLRPRILAAIEADNRQTPASDAGGPAASGAPIRLAEYRGAKGRPARAAAAVLLIGAGLAIAIAAVRSAPDQPEAPIADRRAGDPAVGLRMVNALPRRVAAIERRVVDGALEMLGPVRREGEAIRAGAESVLDRVRAAVGSG